MSKTAKPPAARGLLTFSEVAKLCQVHVATVRRAIARGELDVVNAPGTTGKRGKRVTAVSLQAYLDRQAKPGPGR